MILQRKGTVDAIAYSQAEHHREHRQPAIVSGTRARRTDGLRSSATLMLVTTLMLLATGCHHHRRQTYAPSPPSLRSYSSRSYSPTRGDSSTRSYSSRPHIQPYVHSSPRGPITEPAGRPTLVETGMASWYGPSGRRTADGSAYDGTGMTAAHKTLPLGTVARVTNLTNDESVMVRITDRGPFSHGRILDLSESAAKKIDLYRMGVAKVRIEAYANVAASPTGRWCVQTGAFKKEREALDLKSALLKRYVGSRVTDFPGDGGYWVRIDPPRHDHADAAAIKQWIGDPNSLAVAYLVRID